MKRPLLVTVISLLMIVGGIGQFLLGCVAIASRRNATFLKDANVTTSEATTFAIVLLALGVISVFLGLGLMGGSRVVRGLVGIYEVLQLAGGIYTLVTIESSKRGYGLGQISVALIVLYFRFGTDKAKAFFAH